MLNFSKITQAVLMTTLASSLFPAYAANEQDAAAATAQTSAETQAPSPAPTLQSAPIEDRTYTFADLSYAGSMIMAGNGGGAYIGFGSRLDEIITQGSLDFDFTPSPALLAEVSHIKIYLNNELMGVVAIEDEMKGKKVHQSIKLDPRLFSDYNQLHFELIGDTKLTCTTPNDNSIWAELSQESKLSLKVQKTQLKNDLNLFPAPFFDQRDLKPVSVPMMIGNQPDLAQTKAMGVVAGYFGTLADWRKSDFPIEYDVLPKDNAIVFVTNQNRPSFLKDLPEISGPSLQIMTNPVNPYSKLLLVLGRDGKDLLQAAQGMVFGESLLTGSFAKVTSVKKILPRKPYDAPNWIDVSRPVTFAELVKQAQDLQVEGVTPPPINVRFRLPPDLFTWQSRGIPMDLSYRYSPPQTDTSGSRLSLSLNEGFVKAFNLTKDGHASHNSRLRLPLLDDNLAASIDRIRIPAFKIGSQNDLKFEFGFANSMLNTGDLQVCQTTQPSKQYAAIDPSSTLDFSGFPHYIQMPNLRTFAHAGYPFTRMADLSETVAVMPKEINEPSIQAFVNLMGFFGSQTGYTGFNIQLVDDWDEALMKDKDILAIGFDPTLDQVEDKDLAQSLMDTSARILQLPLGEKKAFNHGLLESDMSGNPVADEVTISAQGSFAAITSQESPFSKNRTLVSLLGNSPESLSLINDSLYDSGKADAMTGSVVSIRPDSVASFDVGEHYYVGELPLKDLIWYHFSKYPSLIAGLAIFVVIMATIVLWRLLRRIATRRLSVEEEDND